MQHRAKKSLGQNFLKSKKALADIVQAARITPGDTVLEVGPGKGALTGALLAAGAHVIAIEKDRELIPLLKESFTEAIHTKQLELIDGDIVEFEPADHPLLKKTYKLVANIPYYITGLLFRKFLESAHQPEVMVFLVQKEVAERIVARDGKESILSISVKAYGTPKYIGKVGKEYFSPAPSVDSAIIAVYDISKQKLNGIPEKAFFDLLHAGFAHKRKKLAGNLKEGAPGYDKETISTAFSACSIDPDARAEELSVEQWICLAQNTR